MISIRKQREPQELSAYRSQPGAVYDGPNFTPVKDKIRAQLLTEQGYLCAYCMSRIDIGKMKIEHWHPQHGHETYAHEQLTYTNLLGVCMGNEGDAPINQHCDTRKGDQLLSYNPANPEHHIEEKLRYLGDGTLKSMEKDFNTQINRQVLNLNWTRLKQNRKAIIDAVQQGLAAKPGTRSKAEIQKLLQGWQQANIDGRLRPYAGTAIYWLNKRLQRP